MLLRLMFLSILGLMFLSGCEQTSSEHKLIVFAASSLTETFEDLKYAFVREHPKAKLSLHFAGSQILRLQIQQGAKVDVFASANPKHMKTLLQQKFVRMPQTFAHNTLVMIVPLSNPSLILSWRDLIRSKRLVIGTEQVPVGMYTQDFFRKIQQKVGGSFVSKIRLAVVSKESNVRLVRAKVAMKEADAAIVYQTDAIASKQVKMIPIPKELNVPARYQVSLVKRTHPSKYAKTWFTFLFSKKGKSILKRRGFNVQ